MSSFYRWVKEEGTNLLIPNWIDDPSFGDYEPTSKEVETFDDDDLENPRVRIPGHFVVCYTCHGKGTHVNPAIDGHGLSQEDFEEDPGFRENYFSGVYDVRCYTCGGNKVILEPNENLTPFQNAAWYAFTEAEYESNQEDRMREQGIQF